MTVLGANLRWNEPAIPAGPLPFMSRNSEAAMCVARSFERVGRVFVMARMAVVVGGLLLAACNSGGGGRAGSGGATSPPATATGGANGGTTGLTNSATGGKVGATGGSGGNGGAVGSGGSTAPTTATGGAGGATTAPEAGLRDGARDDSPPATGGTTSATGGRTGGGGGTSGTGGAGGAATTARDGGQDGPPAATGGTTAATGGTVATGGTTRTGGTMSTGGSATGGTSGAGGGTSFPSYPCPATSTDSYNAVMTKSGSTWTVTSGGAQKYSGSDTQAALTAAYNSLSSGRSSKQSILVEGDGDIPASAQVGMPSYTILNWCGTLNVSGTPSGSDRSPIYARGKTDIDIPNLKMTGAPMYGIFIRETNNVHLGHIELRLTADAGIGIRADSGGSASTMTTFNKNFAIDYVYGTGMSSHIVETYGIDGVKIGTVEGNDVGECGLLLNRSINAEVGLVTCDGCATGTGYAAFRVANDVGKVGSDYPAGNIHVGKVVARGGGRGIFSVSGCGGLTIDQIDIANVGSTSILLQNTYNTTIVAVSGTVVGGLVQISNDTTNTDNGKFPPSENVTIKNLTLSGGASVRQDWCSEFGSNGCTAVNITGGSVSMCQ